jgi:hypothetical protein
LAARFADELNVVFLSPEQIGESLPLIRARCEEIGRDPATLRLIGRYEQVGLARLVAFPGRWSPTEETHDRFAEDCLAAGIRLERA